MQNPKLLKNMAKLQKQILAQSSWETTSWYKQQPPNRTRCTLPKWQYIVCQEIIVSHIFHMAETFHTT
jgi:hypothetical protein